MKLLPNISPLVLVMFSLPFYLLWKGQLIPAISLLTSSPTAITKANTTTSGA